MALWEPSLLMSTYNVRLTSVRVKHKICIYNRLQLGAGFDLHRRNRGSGARNNKLADRVMSAKAMSRGAIADRLMASDEQGGDRTEAHPTLLLPRNQHHTAP